MEDFRLSAHAAECNACRDVPLPLDRIAMHLNAGPIDVDTAGLSQRTLTELRPRLRRRAVLVFSRRVALRVLMALLPLPAVLAYDAYVMRIAYDVASAWLPASIATYLLLTSAAFLVLLFALTYAAIPLLVAHHPIQRAPAEA